MRNCMVLCAVCAVVGLLASVAMADNGLPSASKMQQMGLYGTTVVSDSVAMDVRGFGYSGGHGKKSSSSVEAWGYSSIRMYSKGEKVEAENGYTAKGKTIAAGVNLTVAGDIGVDLNLGGGGGPPGPAVQSNNHGGGSHGGGSHGGGSNISANILFAGGFSAAYAR